MKVNFGRKITLRKDKCDNNKINQEETMIMIVFPRFYDFPEIVTLNTERVIQNRVQGE
jgi:hypothetical protein